MVHEGLRPYPCNICGKFFKAPGIVKNHINLIHIKVEKTFKCESCEKVAATNYELQKHIALVHEGRRDYKCDTCGKDYQTKNALNGHIKLVHDKIRDNHCNLCTKSFSFPGHLKRHILEVHKGIKAHRKKKKKTDSSQNEIL